MSIFEKNKALAALFEQHKERLCAEEGLTEAEIRDAIENGTMVLLGNPNHKGVKPILVGQPARVKVNANIGTSPLQCDVATEMKKLRIALDAGADTVPDLPIAADLTEIRPQLLDGRPAPPAT
ncbi:MAG: phosphomethylpyrimidine synthase ThiC, partial [Mailhella sp.]|nr:phosphomethylpyrimidine synthase ThiC [Mailhella sp.]